MRIIRAGKDVILVPKPGDRWLDVWTAVNEAGVKVGHDWTLQVTTDGRWAFVPPAKTVAP